MRTTTVRQRDTDGLKRLYSGSCILLSELDDDGLRLAAAVIRHEYERCLLAYGMKDKRPFLSPSGKGGRGD